MIFEQIDELMQDDELAYRKQEYEYYLAQENFRDFIALNYKDLDEFKSILGLDTMSDILEQELL